MDRELGVLSFLPVVRILVSHYKSRHHRSCGLIEDRNLRSAPILVRKDLARDTSCKTS
jgi:hypothetical protein